MAQSIEGVDYTIPKEEAVFDLGPQMKPILEVGSGEVVTFETHDCSSRKIQTENDRVADIDFSRVNPATGPVFVRGAEPGDSLVVDILGLRPGPQGVATIIPGRESLEVNESVLTPPQRRFT
jgi:amidase